MSMAMFNSCLYDYQRVWCIPTLHFPFSVYSASAQSQVFTWTIIHIHPTCVFIQVVEYAHQFYHVDIAVDLHAHSPMIGWIDCLNVNVYETLTK